MAGFGKINLAPCIGAGWEVNTAITLPIGLETYAVSALHVSLSGVVRQPRALTFTRASAIGSLVLGAGGQVAYHLLESAGAAVAPWCDHDGVVADDPRGGPRDGRQPWPLTHHFVITACIASVALVLTRLPMPDGRLTGSVPGSTSHTCWHSEHHSAPVHQPRTGALLVAV